MTKELWEADFERMRENNPQDLADLINSGKLTKYQLSSAAEYLGQCEDSELVRNTLVPLLSHKHALVREGVLYGIEKHVDSSVFGKLSEMSRTDQNPTIREIASYVLVEFRTHQLREQAKETGEPAFWLSGVPGFEGPIFDDDV